MDISTLTVYKSPYNKIRVGKDYDGGYIICDIPEIEYDIIISGGIASDISFEEHLCKLYPNILCYGFDGTSWCDVNNYSSNIIIIKKNIGMVNDENNTNLIDLLENNKKIFVKLDIEGDELNWLKILNDEHISNISQLVIEFHWPFLEEHTVLLEKLNKHLVLVHFHGNNCPAGVRDHNGIIVPNIFECTYINKKYVDMEKLELNSDIIPSPILDMPNCAGNDIFIDYPPFVHKK